MSVGRPEYAIASDGTFDLLAVFRFLQASCELTYL